MSNCDWLCKHHGWPMYWTAMVSYETVAKWDVCICVWVRCFANPQRINQLYSGEMSLVLRLWPERDQRAGLPPLPCTTIAWSLSQARVNIICLIMPYLSKSALVIMTLLTSQESCLTQNTYEHLFVVFLFMINLHCSVRNASKGQFHFPKMKMVIIHLQVSNLYDLYSWNNKRRCLTVSPLMYATKECKWVWKKIVSVKIKWINCFWGVKYPWIPHMYVFLLHLNDNFQNTW